MARLSKSCQRNVICIGYGSETRSGCRTKSKWLDRCHFCHDQNHPYVGSSPPCWRGCLPCDFSGDHARHNDCSFHSIGRALASIDMAVGSWKNFIHARQAFGKQTGARYALMERPMINGIAMLWANILAICHNRWNYCREQSCRILQDLTRK